MNAQSCLTSSHGSTSCYVSSCVFTYVPCAWLQLNQHRRLYENVVPNQVQRVQPPPGFRILKFTPCGRYLVALDYHTEDLLLYSCLGWHHACSSGEELAGQLNYLSQGGVQMRFETIFPLRFRLSIMDRYEETCSGTVVMAHSKYLIVLTSWQEALQPQPLVLAEGSPTLPRGITRDGSLEWTTVHVIDLDHGVKTNRIDIPAGFWGIPQSSAISLFGETLTLLTESTQVIYVLHLNQQGQLTVRWKPICGSVCGFCEMEENISDENFTLDDSEEQANGQAAEHGPLRERLRRGETNQEDSHVGIDQSRFEEAEASAYGSDTSNHSSPSASSSSFYRHDDDDDVPLPAPIVGLKQRLLARIYLDAAQTPVNSQRDTHLADLNDGRSSKRRKKDDNASTGNSSTESSPTISGRHHDAGAFSESRGLREKAGNGSDRDVSATTSLQQCFFSTHRHPVQGFFYFFQLFSELRMRAAHLIDDERLLIMWMFPAARDLLGGRSVDGRDVIQHPRFSRLYSVHNLRTTVVERIFPGASSEFVAWCQNHGAAALGGSPCNDWERYLIPGPWTKWMLLRRSQNAMIVPEVKVDEMLPGFQVAQASPYLDRELFQFDERLVPRDESLTMPSSRAAKFVARRRPAERRFAIPSSLELVWSHQREADAEAMGESFEVKTLFHPVEPMVAVVVVSAYGFVKDISVMFHLS